MDSILHVLTDYTFRIVAVGAALLGAVCGMLGTFLVLRRRSLMGDGISHATLPGVVAVFLTFGLKDTLGLLGGALAAGIFAAGAILLITGKSKLRFDAALALVMSVFFGLGMALLTQSQKLENSNQAGLDRFIFGQVSALLIDDVVIMIVIGSVPVLLSVLFFKEIKAVCFDRGFAESVGIAPRFVDAMLDLMTVCCTIMGLQTVGVILMSALLTAPAAAARQWTDRFSVMTLLSCGIGIFSGVTGAFLSTLSPKMPTGPVIVVIVSLIVIFSLLFAPRRGIISRLADRVKIKRIILKKEGKA